MTATLFYGAIVNQEASGLTDIQIQTLFKISQNMLEFKNWQSDSLYTLPLEALQSDSEFTVPLLIQLADLGWNTVYETLQNSLATFGILFGYEKNEQYAIAIKESIKETQGVITRVKRQIPDSQTIQLWNEEINKLFHFLKLIPSGKPNWYLSEFIEL